jgi:hypothetical protein
MGKVFTFLLGTSYDTNYVRNSGATHVAAANYDCTHPCILNERVLSMVKQMGLVNSFAILQMQPLNHTQFTVRKAPSSLHQSKP